MIRRACVVVLVASTLLVSSAGSAGAKDLCQMVGAIRAGSVDVKLTPAKSRDVVRPIRCDERFLPPRGLAVEDSTGVRLITLDGRVLATLKGMTLTSDWRPWTRVAIQDRRERRYELDPDTGVWSRTAVPRGEQPTDWPPLPPPRPDAVGHWRWVLPSATSDLRLAQWGGECETRHAYFIRADGSAVPLLEGGADAPTPESMALGWAPDGRALIAVLGPAACGEHLPAPGVYLVGADRTRTLVATGTDAQMWSLP
jgi:hypothetical protein